MFRRLVVITLAVTPTFGASAATTWQVLDRNGDNVLDRAELDRSGAFSQWDENSDGPLSQSELEQHGKAVTETLRRNRMGLGMTAEPQPWGQPLDTGGDDRVSRKEYYDALVAVHDKNGNVAIDRQEWPKGGIWQ